MPKNKPKPRLKSKRRYEMDTLFEFPLSLKSGVFEKENQNREQLSFWELNGYPSREVVQRIIDKLEQD